MVGNAQGRGGWEIFFCLTRTARQTPPWLLLVLPLMSLKRVMRHRLLGPFLHHVRGLTRINTTAGRFDGPKDGQPDERKSGVVAFMIWYLAIAFLP